MIKKKRQYGLGLLLVVLVVMVGGCVQRTISITSEPSGALVHLNDQEVGRTPLTVSYLYYGVYDVRLTSKGYEPLWTSQVTDAPWWEFPGPDVFAEMIPDVKVQQKWHFVMEPKLDEVDEEALVERANNLRKMAVE